MARNNDTYQFEGRVEASTAKAMLIEFTNSGTQIWVPKSQIKDQEEDGTGKVLFTITAWFAEKEGLA